MAETPDQSSDSETGRHHGDVTADCYSDGERGWMEFGQRLRAIVLQPLLRLLTMCRVTPDAVTVLAAVCGVMFLPLMLLDRPVAALSSLLLHVALDGLDGPLARWQQRASARGSFSDTFADQLVVTVVTITWMITTGTTWSLFAGSVFIFVYALVVAMAMVRNALSIPYSWLVRPRFFVYAAMALDILLGWNSTLLVLGLCDLLLAWKAWTGFRALRKRIPGPTGRKSDDA